MEQELTAQTNESTEVETQDTATAVTEVEESVETESLAEETQTEQEPKEEPKPKQSAEENAEFARRRREQEQAERIAKAEESARVNAIIEAVGTNPYTHKPIEDADDVAHYLLMKRIEKDGGDPIEDFPQYLKKQAREEAEKLKEQETRTLNAKQDVIEFKTKYPNVDLNELAKDNSFDVFSEGKIGNLKLTKIYEQYLEFTNQLNTVKLKAQEEAVISKKAKEIASVGSLATAEDVTANTLYTLEQLKSMSVEEVEKNWDKVCKSKAILKI